MTTRSPITSCGGAANSATTDIQTPSLTTTPSPISMWWGDSTRAGGTMTERPNRRNAPGAGGVRSLASPRAKARLRRPLTSPGMSPPRWRRSRGSIGRAGWRLLRAEHDVLLRAEQDVFLRAGHDVFLRAEHDVFLRAGHDVPSSPGGCGRPTERGPRRVGHLPRRRGRCDVRGRADAGAGAARSARLRTSTGCRTVELDAAVARRVVHRPAPGQSRSHVAPGPNRTTGDGLRAGAGGSSRPAAARRALDPRLLDGRRQCQPVGRPAE